jgi:hypothetical protein
MQRSALSEKIRDCFRQLMVRRAGSARSGDKHQILARTNRRKLAPNRLPHATLDMITNCSLSDALADRKANPNVRRARREHRER